MGAAHPPIAPALHGLRLGFAALEPAAAVMERVLGLVPIPVVPPAAAGRPARRHYALGGLRLEVRSAPLAPDVRDTGAGRPAGVDALQWRQGDLAHRRRHLATLGLAALDGADFGCGAGLRLEAVDTGACAVELREPQDVALAPPVSGPRLAAIDLRVRAPESVAVHWARLLGAPLGRDTDGVPRLEVGPVPVRFVPASAFDGAGVDALVLADPDALSTAQRAAAHGLPVEDDGSWIAAGLRVRQAAR
ncbi:MAG: hypothetical protein RET84_18595 [Pseudomonadota bacterium]|nr:hypothetical protein [Pseudomonadota bacterium]